MQNLFNEKRFASSTRLNRRIPEWRHLGAAAFGAIITTLAAQNGFCLSLASVEISPLVAKSAFLGPVDGNQQISVVLTLPLSDPAGAADFAKHVSRRGDPLFHQYLTPQEFAARYGGNTEDYVALKEWANANGLTVSQESIARTSLTIQGAVSQFQALFNTQINSYKSLDGAEFYSASIKPIVSDVIASRISGVIGLTSGKNRAQLVRVGKTLGENPADISSEKNGSPDTAGGTGPGGSYSAADLRTVYNIPKFGDLTKETVAVFEEGGFTESDVVKYLDQNSLPNVKVTPVSVDKSPTTVTSKSIELEAVTDIDLVIGINPHVQEVRVYEDSSGRVNPGR
jgi:subtilase family serine protease